MKKILFLLVVALLAITTTALAQPKAFKYQAVARGSNGALLVNTNVTVRISIRTGSATGTVEYQETQNVTTNQYGLFAIDFGLGTPTINTFAAINWSSAAQKYVQTEVNLGAGFIDLGASKLLSVPYALFSGSGVSGATGATGATGPQGIQVQLVLMERTELMEQRVQQDHKEYKV